MTTTKYNEARDRYWNAQRKFRQIALNEIAALIPEGAAAAILEINDTPRLSFSHFADANGDECCDVDDGNDDIDQIAADLEVFDWDEADSFLTRFGDTRFIIAA